MTFLLWAIAIAVTIYSFKAEPTELDKWKP